MKQIIVTMDLDRDGPVVEQFKDWLRGTLGNTEASCVSVLSFDTNERFPGDVTAIDAVQDALGQF